MKAARRSVLILAAFGFLLSCSVSKTAAKKETETDTKTVTSEQGTITTKRPGDTLTYTILNPVLKDTTILVKNLREENGNTLRIIYDQAGSQTIDCITPQLEEIREYIRTQEEQKATNITENDKTKETAFKPVFILYVFLGFGGLLVLSRVLKYFGI